ncbi:hypothetical protein GGX14DRAFT_699047, partial [Mycena pura]
MQQRAHQKQCTIRLRPARSARSQHSRPVGRTNYGTPAPCLQNALALRTTCRTRTQRARPSPPYAASRLLHAPRYTLSASRRLAARRMCPFLAARRLPPCFRCLLPADRFPCPAARCQLHPQHPQPTASRSPNTAWCPISRYQMPRCRPLSARRSLHARRPRRLARNCCAHARQSYRAAAEASALHHRMQPHLQRHLQGPRRRRPRSSPPQHRQHRCRCFLGPGVPPP